MPVQGETEGDRIKGTDNLESVHLLIQECMYETLSRNPGTY